LKKREDNPKTRSAAILLPSLDEAVEHWCAARRNFLRRSGRKSFEAFHDATTTLFVAFASDHEEERWAVKAFEAFRKALIAAESTEEPYAPQWLSLLLG
jgi:hypothetical protein